MVIINRVTFLFKSQNKSDFPCMSSCRQHVKIGKYSISVVTI